MKLFERILCPIDFSEDSVKALQWTQYLAKIHKAHVTILHVMEPYPATVDFGIDYDRYHSAVVEDMATFLQPLQISYDSMQSSGLPSEKITTLATTLNSSLIVMSTRGLRGVTHRLIGSTTESVVRQASVPVLTLSPKCFSPGERDQNGVLLPVENINWPVRGCIRLRQMIRELNGTITMMNVVDMKDAMFGSSFDANPALVTTYETTERKAALRKIGFQLQKNSDQIETVIQFGDASQEILKEVQNEAYSWILMAAKHQKFLPKFFGSTAYNVICQAPVPVMTIRV